MSQTVGRVPNTYVAEHIKAEARVRGDLDEPTVITLAETFRIGGETWHTYAEAAEKILTLLQRDPRLDDRTCNALASYLIRRGQGYSHDAVEIVGRYVQH